VRVDVPIDAILLTIYLTGAIANMSIYQINRRKGHKFFMSVALFGFCMSRVATMVLRIVWAIRQANASLAIAAQIFTGVGVLIVYIVLLLLALRIFRATHPKLGWNKSLHKSLTALYMLLFSAFILVITFTILSFYTLDITLRTVAVWIQRAAILYILIFNCISTVMLLLSMLLPRSPQSEDFGTGRMRSKFMILGVALFFALFIAGFRCGTAWVPARPASDPAWYDSKAVFYVVLFSFEIVVVYLLLFTRFDRRFWIPNGSKKPGDYSHLESVEGDVDPSIYLAGKSSGG
jgi:hypothetical protein